MVKNNGSKPYEQMADLEVFPYFWMTSQPLKTLGWVGGLGLLETEHRHQDGWLLMFRGASGIFDKSKICHCNWEGVRTQSIYKT